MPTRATLCSVTRAASRAKPAASFGSERVVTTRPPLSITATARVSLWLSTPAYIVTPVLDRSPRPGRAQASQGAPVVPHASIERQPPGRNRRREAPTQESLGRDRAARG